MQILASLYHLKSVVVPITQKDISKRSKFAEHIY